MGVPGEELEGVMQGVDFLRDVALEKAKKLHGKVFIVGGGNTAIDAARTSLRYGADSVAIEIGTCSLWTLGGNLQLRTLQPQRIARQRDSPEPRPPRGPEPVSHEGGKDG